MWQLFRKGPIHLRFVERLFRVVTGFALASFVVLNAQAALASNVYIKGSSVNLRSAPSTSSRILASLPYRTALTYLGKANASFYKVQTSGGTVGYVASSYVSTFAPQAGTSAAAPSHASSGGGYINSDGAWVRSPVHAASAPSGATALCEDGTYSFSRHRRGTCSHHGGVARWL